MKGLILTLLLLNCSFLQSQIPVEDFKKVFKIEMKTSSSEISIDGKVEEKAWQEAQIGTNFWQKVPFFAESADPKTEVRLTYDENTLYVSAICWQSQKTIIQSLKRDEYWDNDGIAIILDPLNTRTNAFIFGITTAGAQWDALRSQTSGINDDWSNKWRSAVHITDDFWSMEMAIPLRILRYAKDQKEWGMNFVRNHLNESEYHNWTAVPESFWPPDPAFAGNLIWDTAPKVSKGNFNIIPFVTASVNKEVDEKSVVDYSAGLDARISVTSTLNLDATINPDFSQIEADQLVTNLTRFNIFLPERRTFFLENSDLFADFGYGSARPFFSRKIGLDSERQAVPILYGLRLTGNITPTSRIGLMNIHSLKNENSNAQNQSAISYQKRFGRSLIQAMWVNRTGFDDFKKVAGDYGRNLSVEGLYTSSDGRYQSWLGMHQSWKEGLHSEKGFYNLGGQFTNQSWEISMDNVWMQPNYHADLGFVARINNYDAVRDTVIRRGYKQNNVRTIYKKRPLGGKVARYEYIFTNELVGNEDWTFNERNTRGGMGIVFRSRAEVKFDISNSSVQLLYPFSFISDGNPLDVGRYNYSFVEVGFNSDDRKAISYEIGGRTGGFYNGTLHQIKGNVNFRISPWGNLGLEYQWNDLNFTAEYGEETITAFITKMEIGFNTNLLWTTLFQFQDQNEFMGINSRLQWRFAPMSDIYFVFVDNYDVFNGIGGPREVRSNNRALVLKVNYWY